MEKQREQDRADLEMKRLCGVFGSPQPPEEEKPKVDKVNHNHPSNGWFALRL